MEWENEIIVNRIQEGQGNREEMLERLWMDNIGLIRKIIHELTGLDRDRWPDCQDFEDLEQQAFLGIMESIQRYDSARGIKFFTFAVHYIRKSIYLYYDRSGQLLRIPSYMRKRIRDYMGEKERLQEKGIPATDEVIQKSLGLSDRAMCETLKVIRRMDLESLDSYLNESDKEAGTILDMIAGAADTSGPALESTYSTELKDLLRSALRTLPETERNILVARHFQGMGTAHIAGIMNCSRQNVSKHAQAAYKRIRTGKYGQELLTFLPERAVRRAAKRIQDDFKELSEQERGLLL